MKQEQINQLLKSWKKEEKQPFSGWDFSYIADKIYEENPPWDYIQLAKKHLKNAHSLLDLGTGGGERLLELKNLFPSKTVATEAYEPNYILAQKSLKPYGVEVVKADDGLEKIMPFEDNSFELIIDRHTAFNISEIERVLTPGGTFLTQQVDGNNLSDLKGFFKSEPLWPFVILEFFKKQVKKTNLIIKTAEEWSGKMIVKDIGGLVYFLKAIPWFVPGFSVDTHKATLLRLQEKLDKGEELIFTQKRFLLITKKP